MVVWGIVIIIRNRSHYRLVYRDVIDHSLWYLYPSFAFLMFMVLEVSVCWLDGKNVDYLKKRTIKLNTNYIHLLKLAWCKLIMYGMQYRR